jgi:hypothetical protein
MTGASSPWKKHQKAHTTAGARHPATPQGTEPLSEQSHATGSGDEEFKDLDAEIEQMINNQDMLDAGSALPAGASAGPQGGERPLTVDVALQAAPNAPQKKVKKSLGRLPRPNPMHIFRKVSGSAIHFYDWPSANNSYFLSTDEDRVWRSDRHIIIKDEHAPVFDPDLMVDFDEADTFQARAHWDERYNTSVNVGTHDTTMEITNNGTSAAVRMECGDPITDYVIDHVYRGLNTDLRAIANNMTLTNWTPPPGWRLSSATHGVHQGKPLHELLETAYYYPPTASYATWSEPKTGGTSRWVLRVDAKSGPIFLGALLGPVSPSGVDPRKLTSPAWGIDDTGFTFHSDGTAGRRDRNCDLVVAGQVGLGFRV